MARPYKKLQYEVIVITFIGIGACINHLKSIVMAGLFDYFLTLMISMYLSVGTYIIFPEIMKVFWNLGVFYRGTIKKRLKSLNGRQKTPSPKGSE